jgi:hypothetical protein
MSYSIFARAFTSHTCTNCPFYSGSGLTNSMVMLDVWPLPPLPWWETRQRSVWKLAEKFNAGASFGWLLFFRTSFENGVKRIMR